MRGSIAILAVILTAGAGSIAMAQGKHSNPGAGRVAGIAPAPAPPPQIAYPGQYGYPYGNSGYITPGYGVPVIVSVPVMLTPDGRIFADFGYGYEPVLRACAVASYLGSAVTSTGQYTPPTYTPPTYSVPSYSAAPFNQPAPAQPTAADQMIAAAQAARQSTQRGPEPLRTSTVPVSAGCWSTDAYGRVFVTRQ